MLKDKKEMRDEIRKRMSMTIGKAVPNLLSDQFKLKYLIRVFKWSRCE